jgi:hypothetical protein
VFLAQAQVLRTQVHEQRVANRQAVCEEYLYDREGGLRPGVPRKDSRPNLYQARREAPASEVFSGVALNQLLTDLPKGPSRSPSRQVDPPLDPEKLKQINLVVGPTGGNLGLIKNGGQFPWPIAFAGSQYQTQRQDVAVLTEKALHQVDAQGKVDTSTLQKLRSDTDQLQKQLKQQICDMSINQYIEAKMFLMLLNDGVRALEQPRAKEYLNGTYSLKAKTVSELVEHMKKYQLHFAPAMPGSEPAYINLHQSLSTYRDSAAETGNKK